MKCRVCRKKAIIRTISGPFCEKHFIEYYENKIKKTIEEYKMFSKSDKILVAVSGGKDSAALAFALKKLGYEFEGLYINLGIGEYSQKSEEAVKKLFEILDLRLNIVRVEDYEIKIRKIGPREPCSVCGIVKRYLMNKFAFENGFDVLVTAHNLNDEAAFFLNNIFGNKIEFLVKQGPVSPREERFVKKVKPLYFISEKENLTYVILNRIPYCSESCPYSKGNTQIKWKRIIYYAEKEIPFFSYNFVKAMLKLKKKIKFEEKREKKFCKICGYPTESRDGICSFCKLKGIDLGSNK